MENERDLDEYLISLLDYENPKHRQFVSQLKKKQGSNIIIAIFSLHSCYVCDI